MDEYILLAIDLAASCDTHECHNCDMPVLCSKCIPWVFEGSSISSTAQIIKSVLYNTYGL